MNVKKMFSSAVFILAVFIFSASIVSAQDAMMKKETDKPIVAVIKADWCPYCKRVDPVVSDLMKDYGEKMNFVVFDVTDDAAVAASMKKAETLGLSEFFKDYKRKTSTVAVLKNKEIVFKTSNNNKRDDYVKAFEKVLE